ncbi:hypothetical protein BofuT4_P023400.1 [Botrytis cinerea T4]|uniref:Uncharacterized protein n=1 Tax=Botryotinia fuckeliana (strain T4) TaxID=999810 RepID=G2YH38_BOTF4|nr:hypothetical protein BofuT4_P023400.1 [Botrytis cinerea T4]
MEVPDSSDFISYPLPAELFDTHHLTSSPLQNYRSRACTSWVSVPGHDQGQQSKRVNSKRASDCRPKHYFTIKDRSESESESKSKSKSKSPPLSNILLRAAE